MDNSKETAMHHPTQRVLQILELVARKPGQLTLSDLSKELKISKGTIYPILHTLTDMGFLSLTSEMKYKTGIQSYIVGNSFLQQFHFLDEAEKLLAALTAACKETSHLAILVGGNVLYVKKVNSPESIRMVSTVGNQLPAYGTALGKSLLMNDTKAQLHALYPDGLTPITPHTITNIDTLYQQLVQARADGYTTEQEESSEFICCLAVPIRKNHQILAAVSVAIPTFRYSDEKADAIRKDLFETQSQLEYLVSSLDIQPEDFRQF